MDSDVKERLARIEEKFEFIEERLVDLVTLLGTQNEAHSIFNRVTALESQYKTLQERNSVYGKFFWYIFGAMTTQLVQALLTHYWRA